LALVLAGTASALWNDAPTVHPAAVLRGGVSFAAEAQVNPARHYATADGGQAQAHGSTVSVTLPGSVIAQVLQGLPVVWRFDVLGYAQGIAGLTYDLSYALPNDGTPFVIDTVLEGSTMIVYPAAADGDCSATPATAPTPVNGVVTIPGQVLQPPGTNPSGAELVQTWCVWLDWDADPSRYHTNVATATATAEDASSVDASSVFESYIDYPPSLDPLGGHTNIASVEGTGEDGTIARDTDSWGAILYPDPDEEPDVLINLTPRVTVVPVPGPAS
jgi:hypothetical protein